MDIAKIRKKIREIEAGEGAKVGQSAKRAEGADTQPDEKIAEPAANHGLPADAEDQTPGIIREETAPAQKTEQAFQKDPEHAEEEKHKTTDNKIGSEQEAVVEILTFRLMKEEFAFKISNLEEILRYQQITRVPKLPKYVLGITSLRGKVIPVIDLGCKLSLTDKPLNDSRKGKILIIRGPKGPIGAAVDKVIGVVRMAKSEILPPPSHLSEIELKFVEGVAVVDKHFVSIINVEEAVSIRTK